MSTTPRASPQKTKAPAARCADRWPSAPPRRRSLCLRQVEKRPTSFAPSRERAWCQPFRLCCAPREEARGDSRVVLTSGKLGQLGEFPPMLSSASPHLFPVSPARSLVPCPSHLGASRRPLALSLSHDGVVLRARRGSDTGGYASYSAASSPTRGIRSLLCAGR